jgi:hypothetical protein
LAAAKKAILLATAALLSAATLLLARLWSQRASLPYNEEGRYFDAAHSVVYDEGAVGVYATLTVLLALSAAATLFWMVRAWRR